ncbi:hypothetical protein ABXJ76_09225 [Methylobacter sp. G7]
MITGASDHDGKVFDLIRPELANNVLYGDKAYLRSDAEKVRQTQKLTVLTPVKKHKGQLARPTVTAICTVTDNSDQVILLFMSPLKLYYLIIESL